MWQYIAIAIEALTPSRFFLADAWGAMLLNEYQDSQQGEVAVFIGDDGQAEVHFRKFAPPTTISSAFIYPLRYFLLELNFSEFLCRRRS